MKKILYLAACCSFMFASAQTILNKSYPVKEGQCIDLKFDYPQNIVVSSWDKNEVSIQASVTINNGTGDSLFVLEEGDNKECISIRNKKMNFNQLSSSYTLVTKDQVKTFSNKEALKDYTQHNNLSNPAITSENNLEIRLEIKVPASVFVNLKSVYGMVELKDFSSPAKIKAMYGGIDASLSEGRTGALSVESNFGEIYSNLSLNITDKKEGNFHTVIKAKMGTGSSLSLESSYGNIYLRKAL